MIYILKQLCESDNFVTCIQILLNYSLYKKLEKSGIFKACNKLHSLIIYEVSKDNLSDTLDEDHFQKVMLPYSLKFAKQCGKIETSYFVSNMESFFVSKTCNSCLTGKISIDTSGDIKNCPSMPESYGNIKDTTLEEAINKPDFKKYWNVTKDQIDICKDCEFRYVCTDCRAYTERTTFKEDIDLSKPLKCGYNPYTNEWAEWSTNPLKEKAIEYYGMQELVKKDNA
ncbi:grasp-with-spasm system SPASM domain peptide maturase [Nonlabens sp. Ci31]|uniref:grasp-with-spasm system SPASM domain peptide maturase n=1 Tax=Nonlabens sp. Ci31 TaxID=2608253 RepID=UPI001463E689|nr:grasp-with-spasm system SPASM domain peptide maturase [Nonlabens sp. Ci31]QJP33306.1 grasp-with-spasm system SPASM domain peptide maturase [Nonlabens sp. Ci31]